MLSSEGQYVVTFRKSMSIDPFAIRQAFGIESWDHGQPHLHADHAQASCFRQHRIVSVDFPQRVLVEQRRRVHDRMGMRGEDVLVHPYNLVNLLLLREMKILMEVDYAGPGIE